ncbi:MAG: hypothetical protein R2877_05800 [Bdellovibrionota bacterium]
MWWKRRAWILAAGPIAKAIIDQYITQQNIDGVIRRKSSSNQICKKDAWETTFEQTLVDAEKLPNESKIPVENHPEEVKVEEMSPVDEPHLITPEDEIN